MSDAATAQAHASVMSTTEYVSESVEDDAVVAWRFEALRRAGYSAGDAWVVAVAPEIDLRLAERLLADGCPPATALRILL